MKIISPVDAAPWPTLGPQVVDFIRAYLPHGPGDLRGEPARIDAETEALIWRMFEVYPQGHPQAGRRRFKRAALSRRKGVGKTELLAWIAAVELHPQGPVRCDGFDASGEPVGIGVRDPYIPLIAYTEEQSSELAFAALRTVLGESAVADEFDIGLTRITRRSGGGRAVSLAGAPDARDGSRATFQGFDETHRMVLPRQLEAHSVMLANAAKRKAADAWSLEVTTAFVPGENSIAERSWRYGESVAAGEVEDSRFLFFHRGASAHHDLTNEAGVRAALLEASGPMASWTDVDAVLSIWADPTTDRSFFSRVWLNTPSQTAEQAFDVERWQQLVRPGYIPADRSMVALGFDGSGRGDDAALVGCEMATGFVWPIEIMAQGEDWLAVRSEMSDAVADAFRRWNVYTLFANTDFWSDTVAAWAGRFRSGSRERVAIFDAYRSRSKFAAAIRAFEAAITSGELSHPGDAALTAHIGNARRAETALAAEDGQPLHLIRKERSDSPHHIDAAVASVLAWEARAAGTAAGVNGRSRYEDPDQHLLMV